MKFLFYGVIISAISCGLLFPRLGNFSAYIPLMIVLMLFFNFMDITINFRRIFRKELLVTFFLTVVFMPYITHYLLSPRFEDDYRIGLLLVACAPTGIMGIILIRYLKDKDSDLALSNFLFSTFGSIFIIPCVLKLFLGQTVTIQIRPILIQTSALVIIPYITSLLVTRLCKNTLLYSIKKKAGVLIPVMLFFIISTTIGNAAAELRWNMMLLNLSVCVFLIYFVQGGLGYLSGYFIIKRNIKNTLALISSSRNCQIILAVCILNFSPLTAVPIIIAIIFHHIMNAFWLWALQRI